MKVITTKQMQQMITSKKVIVFEKEISSLERGQCLSLIKSEWPVKTNPNVYYRMKMKNDVQVKTLGDNIFIIKK